MHKLILKTFLSLIIIGCTINPPSDYSSNLYEEPEGGQACQAAQVTMYATGRDNELLTIKLGDGFDILEIVPEGDVLSNIPVTWSNKTYDGKELLASLVRPQKLKAGSIEDFKNKTMCVKFFAEAFSNSELNLSNYTNLSGKTCCGTLLEISEEE